MSFDILRHMPVEQFKDLDFGTKMSFSLQTSVIGMGIVFLTLIAICLILVFEGKITQLVEKTFKKSGKKIESAPVSAPAATVADKSGVSEGSANVESIDEETVVAILAAVGEETDIPLSELKIKSIKAL